MKGLSFFSRFAFICNLLYIVCLFIRAFLDTDAGEKVGMVGGTVIVLGWFLAPFLNAFVNLWYGWLLLQKKSLPVQRWLAAANLLFFVTQIFIHFILPA